MAMAAEEKRSSLPEIRKPPTEKRRNHAALCFRRVRLQLEALLGRFYIA
ncbi:hypothetical protein J2Z22_000594 [Paenibacillus forsythiae]|uniref:Uncharacterized protein n=1 Tax=Paenibacillus forsythiae TaxID=365616 RepID=A0ABU3H2N3_9BACL|nr:hypothetical protein [Paenibacillus forsythiae]MDT3425081.1 hypothetical protein [Paenibacillus forsythiae]